MALSFLLTTLSDSIFSDVLGTLQILARLALPTPRDAFLTALAKATLPPHVVAALDEPQCASYTLRSLSLLGDSRSVWREAAEVDLNSSFRS